MASSASPKDAAKPGLRLAEAIRRQGEVQQAARDQAAALYNPPAPALTPPGPAGPRK